MELTFIVEHLALLYISEPQTSVSIEYLDTGAHLIENGIRVVEVGIDGPLQVFVMSLGPHQSSFDSTGSSKTNLEILCSSTMRCTSDSNKALNIFGARVLGRRRHGSGTAGQGGPHSITISDCTRQVRNQKP